MDDKLPKSKLVHISRPSGYLRAVFDQAIADAVRHEEEKIAEQLKAEFKSRHESILEEVLGLPKYVCEKCGNPVHPAFSQAHTCVPTVEGESRDTPE